jgi:alanine racemase
MILLNDSYSAEFLSLHLALQHLSRSAGNQARALIVSQFHDQQVSPGEFMEKMRSLVDTHHLVRLVVIGPDIEPLGKGFGSCHLAFYPSVDRFLLEYPHNSLAHMAVLIKGARRYGLERVVAYYQDKTGRTCLEINLSALRHNYLWFHQHLGRETKIMVMLKALGYGAGSFELARMLQSVQAHYLAVAYIDEGILLRKHGIHTPIMVLGPEPEGIHLLLEHVLEPEVYSLSSLKILMDYVRERNMDQILPIHLNIETGMHRTGFAIQEVALAIKLVNQEPKIKVASIFTHLAASDDPSSDVFTDQQLVVFETAVGICKAHLHYPFLTHVANTAAAGRWPSRPYQMVRLGIGFYGVDPSAQFSHQLQLAFRWVTQINQVHQVPSGETVGYGRAWQAPDERTIATVPVGYADGLRRSLGQGRACLYHRGNPAPIVGKICMDMTMIDVTGLDAREGDEVVIFETLPQLDALCRALDTIPYEIFTGISGRVRRIYLEE